MIKILTNSYPVMVGYSTNPVITIGYLEGVAGIRFAIMEIANLLHSNYSNDRSRKSTREKQLHYQALQLAEDLCTNPTINTSDFAASGGDVVGPAVYLIKLLVRQYGFACLKDIFKQYEWIIPEGLRTTDQV